MKRDDAKRPAMEPIDPADPLVVRYADRSKGWGRAMDRIDRKIKGREGREDRGEDRG